MIMRTWRQISICLALLVASRPLRALDQSGRGGAIDFLKPVPALPGGSRGGQRTVWH